MLTLQATKRGLKEKVENLRLAGKVPAVFYGPKEKSTPITVPAVAFKKVWNQAGESSVIQLLCDGVGLDVLIHDIDLDPIRDEPRHVDFYVIEKGKKVRVHTPIEFTGVSLAVKDLGGTLVKVLHDLEIEAMPKDLPHVINVDISTLVDFNSKIQAKDIVLPKGVNLLTKADEVVASVAEAYKEEEVVAPVDLSAIEVEKKGKEAKEETVGETQAEKGTVAADKPAKKETK